MVSVFVARAVLEELNEAVVRFYVLDCSIKPDAGDVHMLYGSIFTGLSIPDLQDEGKAGKFTNTVSPQPQNAMRAGQFRIHQGMARDAKVPTSS